MLRRSARPNPIRVRSRAEARRKPWARIPIEPSPACIRVYTTNHARRRTTTIGPPTRRVVSMPSGPARTVAIRRAPPSTIARPAHDEGIDQVGDHAARDRRGVRGRGLRHGVSLSCAGAVVLGFSSIVPDSARTRADAASRSPCNPLETAEPPRSDRRLRRAFIRFQNPARSPSVPTIVVDFAPERLHVLGCRVGRSEHLDVGALGQGHDARDLQRRNDGGRLFGPGAARSEPSAVVDRAIGEFVPSAADAVSGPFGRPT